MTLWNDEGGDVKEHDDSAREAVALAVGIGERFIGERNGRSSAAVRMKIDEDLLAGLDVFRDAIAEATAIIMDGFIGRNGTSRLMIVDDGGVRKVFAERIVTVGVMPGSLNSGWVRLSVLEGIWMVNYRNEVDEDIIVLELDVGVVHGES